MRFFSFLFIPILLVSIIGCFGDGEVNIDTPPSFNEAKRIVITSFAAEEKEAHQLGSRLNVNLANRFELILKENEWVYDVSDKVRPVGEKIDELGLTLNDVYADPALAAKVGQALEADIIFTGMVEKPKLDKKDYNEHLMKRGRQSGISGTSTYIRTRQTAIGTIRIKAIDVKTGNILYNNKIRSYLKYWFAYQTQQSGQVIFKEDETMIADLGNHLPRRILYMLYPSGLEKEPQEKVLMKPDFELLGSGGKVLYN